MPGRKAVIVDIDNTVMSCDLRRAMLCSEIVGRPVSEEEVRRDLYCSRILTGGQQEAFFQAYLSTRLMFLDRPYPLVAETLDLLRDRKVFIVFLSGRFRWPVDKGAATVEFMRRYSIFREGDRALFKPSASVYDFEFKRGEVRRLKRRYDVLWAIDDSPRSLLVSKLADIFSIGITTSYSPLRFDFADLTVDGWDEMKALVEAGKL